MRYGKPVELTRQRLKELVNCDPETGIMTLKIKPKYGRNSIDTPIGFISTKGYVCVRLDGHMHRVHRLVWLYVHGEWPHIVDHVNRDKADNRIDNLRNVTESGNKQNMKLRTNNSTGVNGVYWDKAANNWLARMWLNKKDIYLGKFDNFFDACCARKSADNLYGFHPNHGRSV